MCPLASTINAQPVGFPLNNIAVGGKTVATMVTNGSSQVDAIRRVDLYRQIAFIWGGLNDDANGTGADYITIFGRLKTWGLARKAAGFRVIVGKPIDCASVDGLVRWHTDYPLLAAMIDADSSWYDDKVDPIAADARFANANDTSIFQTDKTHLNATGNAVYAAIAAPVFARQAI